MIGHIYFLRSHNSYSETEEGELNEVEILR